MKHAAGCVGLIVLLTRNALAADTLYTGISKNDYQRIEQSSNGTIWLMANAPSNTPTISNCQAGQVLLMPPTGREKEWLALVISAWAMGKAIQTTGYCDTTISALPVIVGNRLIVDFQ